MSGAARCCRRAAGAARVSRRRGRARPRGCSRVWPWRGPMRAGPPSAPPRRKLPARPSPEPRRLGRSLIAGAGRQERPSERRGAAPRGPAAAPLLPRARLRLVLAALPAAPAGTARPAGRVGAQLCAAGRAGRARGELRAALSELKRLRRSDLKGGWFCGLFSRFSRKVF